MFRRTMLFLFLFVLVAFLAMPPSLLHAAGVQVFRFNRFTPLNIRPDVRVQNFGHGGVVVPQGFFVPQSRVFLFDQGFPVHSGVFRQQVFFGSSLGCGPSVRVFSGFGGCH